MAIKKQKLVKKLEGYEINIDVLERFAAASLYMTTDLKQTSIAKVLGVGNDRISEILKGVEKQK
ncbi:hypothetical protein HY469_05495 [Candidatus Roizmanbacteria bacterium]|nr:hypothetical protein [Candidatus Roizmanbacteria bacterium]